jgi:Spy/CpxP family protein refolding chaperone
MRYGKQITLWLAVALAVAAVAAAAPGRRDQCPCGMTDGDGDHPVLERFHEERMEHLAVFLDLTDQQVEQWRAVHESRRQAMSDRMDTMRGLHERIEDLAGAETPDAAAIGELVIEAHRLRAAAELEHQQMHEEVMALLTPEQRERFEKMRELGPMDGPRGHHGGWHHGPQFGDGPPDGN